MERVLPVVTFLTAAPSKLSEFLNTSLQLQKNLNNSKWFKSRIINKIKKINIEAMKIVEIFNENTIYK